MSNEKSVPEQIAERVAEIDGDKIVWLLDGSRGGFVASLQWHAVKCPPGEELDTIRVWLAGLIREGFAAGVASVAQTKADGAAALVESYGPDALAKARKEGRADAFRKVAEWCQTSVPDTFDFDASIVEEVAKDAIGQLQHDAYNGDSRAREEGRRQGWEEATARVERRLTEAQENGVSLDERIDALHGEIKASDSARRNLAQKAAALRAALAELNADAPKEPA